MDGAAFADNIAKLLVQRNFAANRLEQEVLARAYELVVPRPASHSSTSEFESGSSRLRLPEATTASGKGGLP
jgi:hypothetical protein